LEIVKAQLEHDESIVVVYTQPWQYDPATDPKATLIGEVLTEIRKRGAEDEELWKTVAGRFKKLVKRVKWSKAIGLAVTSAVSFTPPAFEKVAAIFGENDEEPEEPTLQGFRDEFEGVMEDLKSITRVVVLVDDLDRCLPPSVIGSLEAIKLFLSVQKMGFVIAADERSVQLSIATRYEGSNEADEMAQQYLEKIVQIPVQVPSLGESDTEAYLALLLLHRHFAENEDGFKAIVEHCANQRAKSVARVLNDLPADAIPEEAKEDFSLAPQLAPVLAERVEGNPRRLKRFLNAYWLRSDIARRRNAALEPRALAKLLLLERHDKEDRFRVLLGWLNSGQLKDRLKKLEEAEDDSKLDEEERPFFWWSRVEPKLAGEDDLGPYLRLAASLKSVPGARTDLDPEMAALADELASDAASTRSAAQDRAKQLPSDDKVSIARELVLKIQADPNRQDDISESLKELAADEAAAAEIAKELQGLDPRSIALALPINLGEFEPIKAVFEKWAAGDQLEADTKKAIEGVLKGQ
jgi:hypothetical protein